MVYGTQPYPISNKRKQGATSAIPQHRQNTSYLEQQSQTRPGKKMTEERDAGKRRLCLMAGIGLKFHSFHLPNLDKQT